MSDIHGTSIQPVQLLVDNIDLFPRGRALDVAMGNGRNAVYLAKKGFEVLGIDISPEAVKRSLDLAVKCGVSLRTRVVDLEQNSHIEEKAYDLIICFNYLQRSLFPHIKEGLRTGGMVVYETFTVDQARFGKPKNPEYLLKHNELLRMFLDFRVLRYYEGLIKDERAVAGIIAQRPLC